MRHWTEDEVRAELPRLRAVLDVIARSARQATAARSNGHRVGPSSAARPVGEPPLPATVEEALEELRRKEVLLRDPDTGLVDFPAITGSGVVYLLCWRRDEEDLGWWHFAEEGYAERKPLPVPPDL
ncbi:MAG: DUF2203 domain-containing protein [Acidimicrobiales bacterium]